MEITIYNKSGRPEAYIADDVEQSIYLWSGHTVAYLLDNIVYGWNGKHLGWFEKGIMYDFKGLRVGFLIENCPCATYAEPAKYPKNAKYEKYARCAAYAKLALSEGNSGINLKEFLESGKV